MIIEEGTYLEHYGKKGMKWGVRNRYSTPNEIRRHQQGRQTGLERAGSIAGGYLLGSVVSLGVLRATGNMKLAQTVTLPASVAGGLWIRSRSLKQGVGGVKVSDLDASKADQATRDRVEAFVKKHPSGSKGGS